VLPEYFEPALDVLADILRPSLRQDDFDTEKSVILDEIARYDVQPGYACYDKAKQIFYGDHPLGQSVLGTNESITALKREQMLDYFQRRYVAPNILAVAAGNFDWPGFVKLIERHCAAWQSGPTGRRGLVEAKGRGGVHTIRREKVSQEYVTFWAPAPAADSMQRYAAHVLTSIIGDYTGSRLYWELVDPGLADSADMGYLDQEKAGAYIVSLSCQPENAASNRATVVQVLTEVQTHGVSEEELTVARTRLASRQVRAGERTFRRMLDIGRDWTYLAEYRTLDDELEAIDAVDAKAIRELLDRYPITDLTTVALGPLEKLA
jgi:predicted Zn-dependent peptidase